MFNLSKKWFPFAIILMVSGCKSTPQTSNYYLIESTASKYKLSSVQQIALYPIQLSDYLRSTSLHVKSNSGQVSYSSTDFWAEQPSKMLWRAIQQNLEDQTGHHVLASYDAPRNCAQIKIRVDELSPSTTGNVVTSGRWFISVEDKTLQTNKFSFSGKIDNDGYPASNLVTANHLHELASQLDEQIRGLGLCQS